MECKHCKKQFKTETRFKTHIDKCSLNDFTCFICSKQFTTNYNYKRHYDSCKNNMREKILAKEQEYKQKIQHLEQQLDQKEKEFKTSIKLKEQEIIIQMKEKENSLIKQLGKSNIKNSNNKTYNVNITNNFNSTGISSQELEKEFTDFFTRFPYLVTEKTFHKLLVNSSLIKQNLFINDQARGITSYFDSDEQRVIKDTKMKNLTKKSVECIGPSLSQQMIDFADLEERTGDSHIHELNAAKSKLFVKNVVQSKNVDSNLLRESENKTYENLKSVIPNNTDIEKLNNVLCELCNNNILLFIFASWEDIGFSFGKYLTEKYSFKLDNYDITIEKNKYRRIDFQRIIYSIYELLIHTHELIISALINSEIKLGYTHLSGKELDLFVKNKVIPTNCIFVGLQNSLDI